MVLIPLNSGLVFTFVDSLNVCRAACLNPFEFRAGIYLQAQGGEGNFGGS